MKKKYPKREVKKRIESAPEEDVIRNHEIRRNRTIRKLGCLFANFTRGGLVHMERVGRML